MTKTFCLALLFVGLAAVAGCTTDPTGNADLEGQRGPAAGPAANSFNSPTAGPTSAGLPGGTETSDSPEVDPDRGARAH